jgi:hypothetical protein
MRTSNRRFASTGLLIMGVTTLVAVGCDKVPLTAPGNSTVTLTTATAANGNVEVVATVLEQAGTPVQDGTTVRFSSSLGRMDPAEVQTRNSMARSTFIPSGDSGETTITVSSGTATANVKFNTGLALIEAVSVRASAGSVPATGGTVTITARVTATGGNAMSGVPVTFSTTAGTLSGTREVTDGNGEASTRLTTDANATVTATAGTKTATVAIQALNPVPTPTVSLTGTGATATHAGQIWTFTTTVANNTAVGSPTKFEWNFGDGSPVVENQSPSVQHAYTTELTVFHVSVKVTFANGSTATATADIITADFP